MRRLISLTLLVALLAGIDLGAKSVAESQIEDRARQEAPRGSEARGSISSFPFLGRLLLFGTIRETTIELRNTSQGDIVFDRVTLTMRGVEIDRSRLIRAQEAEITNIDSGTVSIEVTEGALSEKLRVPISITTDGVTATVEGAEVRANATVDGGVLSLALGPLPPLSVRIPTTNYAPCVGDITLLSGRIRFTCTINEVPPAFLGAANRAVR